MSRGGPVAAASLAAMATLLGVTAAGGAVPPDPRAPSAQNDAPAPDREREGGKDDHDSAPRETEDDEGSEDAPSESPAPTDAPAVPPPPPSAPPADVPEVTVRGESWPSPRGLGDVRVQRDQLEASPRQQTSEMLSAAPGFFVDHEDGEGLANDVFLRGFDLEHGSGIEMRVGAFPINIPLHIQGQGYADANFIIPEVVRSIRVLEGPFDPRQGDAAIVGSAYFDLGVPRRGYRASATYGSFNQMRLMATAAPEGADADTFAAFSVRKTDGFGTNRDGLSASANAQYAVDLGVRDRLRVLATAYSARSSLAGVIRRDHLEGGRIGLYDSYPYFAEGQSVASSRVLLGVTYEHDGPGAARIEVSPWVMFTDFRARQNYAGSLESSEIDPRRSAIGDLFETTNRETATGTTARLRLAKIRPSDSTEIAIEPGVYARGSHTDQTKSLLVPATQMAWDRRIDAGVNAFDLGAYVDADVRLWQRLRIAGGARVDLLWVSVDDRLAAAYPPPGPVVPTSRDGVGVAPGLRLTAEYELFRWLSPVVSFGQGFRSLAAERIGRGSTEPYSAVTSIEGGVRVLLPDERWVTRLSAFETRIDNELVFEATSGGLETQNKSVRRGFVGSITAKPNEWLLASTSLSLVRAVYATRVPGVSHFVPNIPSGLLRADVTARGRLTTLRDAPLIGRVGVGYTMLAGRHLTDAMTGPTYHVVNAGAAIRYGALEFSVDAYNVLDSQNPDDEQVYVSNWSFLPGQQPASMATHLIAAPPRTVLGTLTVYF
ncbi:MAG: TonB-dependent receptor [Polyangiaceae bacterium]